MLLKALFIASALAFAPVAASAQNVTTDITTMPAGTYKLDKSHASVLFKISHLGFSDYVGRFNDFDATIKFDPKYLENSSVSVTIDPRSVDTNHPKMKEKLPGEKYFNADVFPQITFESTAFERTGEVTGLLTGDLTLLGVTKPVSLDVEFVGGGMNPFAQKETIGFRATGSLNRSDFGMTELVPMIGAQVHLQIDVEFNITEQE